ncbi:armadillo-type protein [Chlamydoabsidia padenii]|nr:armadillo-type protein [Chlamydoabsidia padenii]
MDTPQEDFQSLSITDRLQHKVWKARQSAYTELYDLFRKTVEDADFYQYEGYLKNMATDANAIAQEAGLNAIYEYVNNAPNASSTRESIIPGLVQKCLGAPKAGTKQKATDIILLYAEIDVADPIVELVLPGLEVKQPKLVTQTVVVLRELVRQFGTKTVSPKPLIKVLPKLFGHTDKNVRAETSTLTIEIYRWIGAALTPSLSDLKPVQIKELEEAFGKLPSERPTPERLLRSEQQKAAEKAAIEEGTGDSHDDDNGGNPVEEEPMDPYDFADPVDITATLPGNFHELLASKKWQERREALDALLQATKTPKIMDKDYSELVGALTKRINDANILLVGVTANCIEAMAIGLRSEFGKYKGLVTPPLIEKLKERKPAILEQLANSLHAVFSSVPLMEITEDLTAAVKHKNPQIRAQSVKLVTRQLQTIRQVPSKAEIKIFAEMMLKTLDDADAAAREASAEGLGTLSKVVGEKTMLVYTDSLDDIKKNKIKEYFDKAEVKAKPVVAKKPPPPVKKAAPPPQPKKVVKPVVTDDNADDSSMPATEMTPPKRKPPARLTGAKKPTLSSSKPPSKPAAAPASSAGGPKKAAKLPPSSGPEEVKYKYSAEDAEARVNDYIPTQIWEEIGQSQWKARLAAMESLHTHFESSMDPSEIEAEIVIRCLSKKPGWKEMNFQVMTKLYGVMQLLATTCPSFTRSCAAIGIPGMVEKLGDIKLKKPAGECLVAFAEKTSLQFVLSQSYPIWKKAKSPKVVADSLIWIHQALSDFGISGLQIRDLIDFVKTALSNTNAAVRTSAVTVLGVLRMYIGPEIITFVQDVSPALMANIESEFEKVSKMDPPQPTKVAAASSNGGGGGGANADADALDSLIPRVDISNQLAKTASDCNDSNWKKRKEGLDKVLSIIEGANKRIKPNLGEFPSVLKQRLNDSNKILQIQAVEITGLLVVSMGKPFEKYVKILAGNLASVLSDNKANVRSAGVATLETIRQTCGMEGLIGAFGTSLAADSPTLRKELLTWLSTCLAQDDPSGVTVDYSPLISPVLSCLQDRNAEVRKAAQAVLPVVVANTGYDSVMNKVSELKGAQKQSVMPFVEAARGSAPATSTTPAAATAAPPTKLKRSSTISAASGSSRRPDSAGSNGSDDKAPPSRLKSTLGRKKLLAPRTVAAASATSSATSAAATTTSTEQAQPPLLTSDPRAKQMRAKKEIRWQFDSPRSDVIDTLRAACEPHIHPDICSLMFSTNQYAERDRLNALTQLNECISQPDASMDKYGLDYEEIKRRYLANADLLFKYLTIRFFDTNTSMLIKCLDLAQHLVAVFDSEGAPLSEYEAVSFLPFLINKVGDPKETMRARIRSILTSICVIYPASKMLNFLLDTAANSKNAKARAECLDEVGSLIQQNGTAVMLPNKALPLIATHIGDRDAGVRNAALSAIAQAYILIGDPVFKYVSRLGEKEKGMLEERLKRTKPSPSVLAEKERQQQEQEKQQESDEMDVDNLPPISSLPRTPRSRIGKPRSLPQPSHNNNRPPPPIYNHQDVDSTEEEEDATMGHYHQDGAPEPRTLPGPSSMRQPRTATQQQFHQSYHAPPLRQQHYQSSPHQQQQPASPYYSPQQQQNQREYLVDYIIAQITSGDPIPSIEALKQLERSLTREPELILPDMGPLINAITLQVRLVYSTVDPRSPVTTRLCKHLVNALVLLFSNRDLAVVVSQDGLHHLLQELAHRLLDQNMLSLESGPQLSKALNVAMVKVLENSERNATFSALLSILSTCAAGLRPGDSSSSKETKYTELIMKCLWKLAKTIQENLRSGTLQPDHLLFEINKFFLVTPPIEWKRRTQENVPLGELPLRTVKTLLLEMVNGLGEGVFQHLDMIEDPQESSVYPYLHHMLEACRKKREMQQMEQQELQQQQEYQYQVQQYPPHHTPPPANQSPISHQHHEEQQPGYSSRPSSMSSIRSSQIFRSTSISSFPSSDGQITEGAQPPPPPLSMHVAGMTTYPPSPMAESQLPPPPYTSHYTPNRPTLSDYEMNNILKTIFEKIGTREETKQGIVELYDFQKKYPLAETKVNIYLSQTGTYFQRYIRRGLSNLAAEDHDP